MLAQRLSRMVLGGRFKLVSIPVTKISEILNLKERKVYLGPQFQGLPIEYTDPLVLWRHSALWWSLW